MSRFTKVSQECQLSNRAIIDSLSSEIIQECKTTNNHIKRELRDRLEK